jgi:uncharacterized DUF497 family protein
MEAIVEYEWDENKAIANFAKHGVAFDAIGAFEWETAGIFDDHRFDYGENRQIALGYLGNTVHVVTFTKRNGKTRIIGLRKANKRERKRYEKEKKAVSH